MKKIGALFFVLFLLLSAAAYAEEDLPRLRTDKNWKDFEIVWEMTVFGNKNYPRGEIQSIVFERNASGKNNTAWDVSEDGDGSVLAWVTGDELHIAAAKGGKIALPEDCETMFEGYGATSIRFNNLVDTSSVVSMNGMFRYCLYLVDLDLSGFDTSNVTNMAGMFYHCDRLPGIDLSGFHTSACATMSNMFYMCCDLDGIDVSGFDTSKVKSMKCMFYGCGSLTALDVTGFDTSNVTDMEGMFGDCVSLGSIDVSGFDMCNVINATGMFNYCKAVNQANIRDKLSIPKDMDITDLFEDVWYE